MLTAKVRIGAVADQDRFRREDMLAMTPEERIMTLIKLRNRQFGAVSRPIRDSGIVSYRTLATERSSGT
jgi:hypothetical protein